MDSVRTVTLKRLVKAANGLEALHLEAYLIVDEFVAASSDKIAARKEGDAMLELAAQLAFTHYVERHHREYNK